MTQAEKKMNKEDLYAYKHGDESSYALLPGVSPIKKQMDLSKHPEMSL